MHTRGLWVQTVRQAVDIQSGITHCQEQARMMYKMGLLLSKHTAKEDKLVGSLNMM